MNTFVARCVLMATVCWTAADSVAQPFPSAPGTLPVAARRSLNGVQCPDIDAAWVTHDQTVSEAWDRVAQTLDRCLEAAVEEDASSVPYWKLARESFVNSKVLPLHKDCAAAVTDFRKTCSAARVTLRAAYRELGARLKGQGQHAEAKSVEAEWRALADDPHEGGGEFQPAAFGLEDSAVLGVVQSVTSWQRNPVASAREFVRRSLPPYDGEGILITELGEVHADSLRKHDILSSVNGVHLDDADAWQRVKADLRVGHAVPAVVERVRRGAWAREELTLVPVSGLNLDIRTRIEVYASRCQPVLRLDPNVAADARQIKAIRDDVGKLTQDVVTLAEMLDDPDGRFAALTVAVSAEDDAATVRALEDLGAERLRLMDSSVRKTNWGKLQVAMKTGANETNGLVLKKAWEAVRKTFFTGS